MSALLLSPARENPWPALALASLNLVVALTVVGTGLVLGVTVSLLAWLHALVDRDAVPAGPRIGNAAARRPRPASLLAAAPPASSR